MIQSNLTLHDIYISASYFFNNCFREVNSIQHTLYTLNQYKNFNYVYMNNYFLFYDTLFRMTIICRNNLQKLIRKFKAKKIYIINDLHMNNVRTDRSKMYDLITSEFVKSHLVVENKLIYALNNCSINLPDEELQELIALEKYLLNNPIYKFKLISNPYKEIEINKFKAKISKQQLVNYLRLDQMKLTARQHLKLYELLIPNICNKELGIDFYSIRDLKLSHVKPEVEIIKKSVGVFDPKSKTGKMKVEIQETMKVSSIKPDKLYELDLSVINVSTKTRRCGLMFKKMDIPTGVIRITKNYKLSSNFHVKDFEELYKHENPEETSLILLPDRDISDNFHLLYKKIIASKDNETRKRLGLATLHDKQVKHFVYPKDPIYPDQGVYKLCKAEHYGFLIDINQGIVLDIFSDLHKTYILNEYPGLQPDIVDGDELIELDERDSKHEVSRAIHIFNRMLNCDYKCS